MSIRDKTDYKGDRGSWVIWGHEHPESERVNFTLLLFSLFPSLYSHLESVCSLCSPGNSTVTFKCVRETDLVLIHSNKLNYTQLEDTHIARISHSGRHTHGFLHHP